MKIKEPMQSDQSLFRVGYSQKLQMVFAFEEK